MSWAVTTGKKTFSQVRYANSGDEETWDVGGFANIDRVRASSLAEKPAHETDSPCLPAPRYHPAIIIFLLNIDPYRLEFIIKIETIIMLSQNLKICKTNSLSLMVNILFMLVMRRVGKRQHNFACSWWKSTFSRSDISVSNLNNLCAIFLHKPRTLSYWGQDDEHDFNETMSADGTNIDDEKEEGDSNDLILMLLIRILTTDDDNAEYVWTLEHMAKDVGGSLWPKLAVSWQSVRRCSLCWKLGSASLTILQLISTSTNGDKNHI